MRIPVVRFALFAIALGVILFVAAVAMLGVRWGY